MTDDPTREENHDQLCALLLAYFALLAERNAYAPQENFEYALWDELKDLQHLTLLSLDEATEIIALAIRTDSWVAYHDGRGVFQVVDMDAWYDMLETRGH